MNEKISISENMATAIRRATQYHEHESCEELSHRVMIRSERVGTVVALMDRGLVEHIVVGDEDYRTDYWLLTPRGESVRRTLLNDYANRDKRVFTVAELDEEIVIEAKIKAEAARPKNIDPTAFVSRTATVGPEAQVRDDASVTGDAAVRDQAAVTDRARVYDVAQVSGHAKIREDARVDVGAQVSGQVTIEGRAVVAGQAQVSGKVRISGSVHVRSNARVRGHVFLTGFTRLGQDADVFLQGHVIQIDGLMDWPRVTVYRTVDGTPRVQAGCQNFTLDEIRDVAGVQGITLSQKIDSLIEYLRAATAWWTSAT